MSSCRTGFWASVASFRRAQRFTTCWTLTGVSWCCTGFSVSLESSGIRAINLSFNIKNTHLIKPYWIQCICKPDFSKVLWNVLYVTLSYEDYKLLLYICTYMYNTYYMIKCIFKPDLSKVLWNILYVTLSYEDYKLLLYICICTIHIIWCMYVHYLCIYNHACNDNVCICACNGAIKCRPSFIFTCLEKELWLREFFKNQVFTLYVI